MRILVTRPEPDTAEEAEHIAARGHEPVAAPLLAIELCRPELPLAGAYGLIVTSRNALRALAAHPDRVAALKLPLYAVGEATAETARNLGFAKVTTGPGTAKDLAALIAREVAPERGPLVHLAGETLAFDLEAALGAQGFDVKKVVLYRTVPAKTLPPEARNLIAAGGFAGVVLMSPRTAKIFAALIAAHGLVTEAKSLVCYCLSEAVAEAVAPLGCKVRVAARPREEDVLALLDAEAAS
ncbi:MAG: uroporphyrinogen-III synthase [Methyloceanibacter sp.]